MRAYTIAARTAKTASVMARWALLGLLATSSPATAQYASSCPPPQKLAAGACVTACPGGYEDRGRECVFRSMSR